MRVDHTFSGICKYKDIDEKHEGWGATQSCCDYFCRVEHDIHICWSSEDFKDYLRFDIWKTCTMYSSLTLVLAFCEGSCESPKNKFSSFMTLHIVTHTPKASGICEKIF